MFEFFNALGAWPKTGLLLVATFIVHLIISRIVLRGMKQMAARTDNDLDDRLVHFLQRFYVIVLIFVAFLISLRIHGIQITPFLASAGIAGIAIGMAAKETLADILAGVFLIADRPIRVGDRVKIDSIGRHWGAWGDIVDLGLRRTRIRNTDGVIVNYPNNLLEGRYRIAEVRDRSKIRSVVLANIAKACQNENIALASPRVRVEAV